MDSVEITKPCDQKNNIISVAQNSEKGLAAIKSEFIVKLEPIEFDSKYITSNGDGNKQNDRTQLLEGEKRKEDINEGTNVPKKMKGQNKHRRNVMFKERKKIAENSGKLKLCLQFCRENTCIYGDKCTFSHDVETFVSEQREEDISDVCHNFASFGKCNYGVVCRFGGGHLKDGKFNIIDQEKFSTVQAQTSNHLTKDLQISLRRKKYDFKKANTYSGQISSGKLAISDVQKEPRPTSLKKKIDFKNKLYLAPLTTVGNLPFRRICKEFGADITCGEMALCTNILEGSPSEWALLRRHHSEDIFGVQICGSSADQLGRCAQLITEQCDVDFIDLNMGCPIDLVYKKGAGSALMERKKKLNEIIYSITSTANVPLTLKMRTGVYQGKNIAKGVISTVREWSEDRIGLITIHGRSREQRYTKSADWEYIKECALEAGRPAEGLTPIPVFGSGDVMSHEEYYEQLESTGVSGIMLARGALIKPWLFTEIKERRTWDISASERMDILKKYVNYGLENWGSDSEGVEKTRRFLLEWLSFLHRYIPVGVMERLPQRINERPPRYIGRNDLETLLSSGSCKDWIAISEMLLGKVPPEFSFIPKHKANAY